MVDVVSSNRPPLFGIHSDLPFYFTEFHFARQKRLLWHMVGGLSIFSRQDQKEVDKEGKCQKKAN